MIKHSETEDRSIHSMIRKNKILFGGNLLLKIYGSLHCRSGKRMLRKNRVFFFSEAEAIAAGYRPCGHCMREAYKKWRMIR